jgi:hypothetical protein
MASAHVVFANSRRNQIIDSVYSSETVASGSTSAAAGPYSVASITAYGAAVYVAVGTGTPSAAANPRLYVADGTTVYVAIAPGVKVAVLDA